MFIIFLVATAEVLVQGFQRGDLDCVILVNPKNNVNIIRISINSIYNLRLTVCIKKKSVNKTDFLHLT
jgi:hypothetical protein